MPSEKRSNIVVDGLVGFLVGGLIGLFCGGVFAGMSQVGGPLDPVLGVRFGPIACGLAGLLVGIGAPRIRQGYLHVLLVIGAATVGALACIPIIGIDSLWPENFRQQQHQLVWSDAFTPGLIYALLAAGAVVLLKIRDDDKQRRRRHRHRDDDDHY